MGRDPKRKPLTVKVSKGVLTIEIGVETLAFAAIHSPWAFDALGEEGARTGALPDTRFSVRYPNKFAEEVRRALTDELGEDGSSILTNAIDKATEKAVNDGSLYFIDKNEGA